METLFRMLDVFCWILVIGCPLLIFLKVWMQFKYEKSLEKTIDNLKGIQKEYNDGLGRLIILFAISLVYLIVR